MLGANRAAKLADHIIPTQVEYVTQPDVQHFPMREQALQAALSVDRTGDPGMIIKAAERFHAFLTAADLPPRHD